MCRARHARAHTYGVSVLRTCRADRSFGIYRSATVLYWMNKGKIFFFLIPFTRFILQSMSKLNALLACGLRCLWERRRMRESGFILLPIQFPKSKAKQQCLLWSYPSIQVSKTPSLNTFLPGPENVSTLNPIQSNSPFLKQKKAALRHHTHGEVRTMSQVPTSERERQKFQRSKNKIKSKIKKKCPRLF